MSVEYCATNARGWDFFSLELPDLDTLPDRLDLPSPHFTCLMVCNAQTARNAALEQLADRLLQQGLAFLCAWGPDCERVSHLFEHAAIQYDFKQGREYPTIISMNLRRQAGYRHRLFPRCLLPRLGLSADVPVRAGADRRYAPLDHLYPRTSGFAGQRSEVPLCDLPEITRRVTPASGDPKPPAGTVEVYAVLIRCAAAAG